MLALTRVTKSQRGTGADAGKRLFVYALFCMVEMIDISGIISDGLMGVIPYSVIIRVLGRPPAAIPRDTLDGSNRYKHITATRTTQRCLS